MILAYIDEGEEFETLQVCAAGINRRTGHLELIISKSQIRRVNTHLNKVYFREYGRTVVYQNGKPRVIEQR